MAFIDRMEKNIAKLERRIEREQGRIAKLEEKCEAKKITRADYNIKRRESDERTRGWNARIQTLKGGIVREKKHLEEKQEEKEKKREEKEKKKERAEKKEEAKESP